MVRHRREVPQSELVIKAITTEEVAILIDLLEVAKREVIEFCKLYEIDSLAEFPAHKYKKTCERLAEIIFENGNN